MPGSPVRYGSTNPAEPALHELPPLTWGEESVPVHLEMRRTDDGIWRGRLLFGPVEEGASAQATADIFCAESEADLWQCVQDIRHHHLRDLYRSVAE